MDAALEKLMKRMPPLENSPDTEVNWALLEKHVGLTYPDSYKEFIGVYGSCRWFGSHQPFYETPTSERAAREFVKRAKTKAKLLDGHTLDENYSPLDVPLYPKRGGLFPFMASVDGPIYCWKTGEANPNRWPVYCWETGPITVFKKMTVAGLLLGYLTHKRHMIRLWGDSREVAPEDLALRRD